MDSDLVPNVEGAVILTGNFSVMPFNAFLLRANNRRSYGYFVHALTRVRYLEKQWRKHEDQCGPNFR